MADDEKLPLLTSGSTVVGHLPIYQSPRETYIDQQPLPQNGYFNSISQTQTDTIEPVSLSWENINVYVREKKKKITVDAERLTAGTHNVNTSKQILQNVSGVVKPGTLVAIMGASGAGKSTLMNVLTNRNLRDYHVQGKVKVNGIHLGRNISSISAYVQQDDLFMSTLTVRETLTFRALLRMDKSLSKKDRLDRVEEVILEMGLTKCSDTQIGKVGSKKGISGGESKRLSFACEMLTNPPLLFCDEPTSGLDSFMAQNLVQMLQTMAAKNRVILCTIHQPSSEIFALFDQLLLMAEGRVAFMGSSLQAVEYFHSLGYSCPSNFNPADFYVLTLAIVPGKEDECGRRVNAICDAFNNTREAEEMKEVINELAANSLEQSGHHWVKKAVSSKSRYETSCGRQFAMVFWRSWISLWRDVILFRVRVMQTMAIALLLGLIYLQLTYDQNGVRNINGVIFLLITNASFANMFAVVNTFPNELALFLREYGSGLYRTDVYYIAKCLAEMPTFILLPAIMVSIDYWMIGLYATVEAYLIAMGVITLVANVAVSFGYVISTAAGNVNIALAIAPPLLIPFMMFGGFFLSNASVPVYFYWLKYLSWFLYGNELLCVNQWKNVNFIECDQNVTFTVPSNTTSGGRCFHDGNQVLHDLGFSTDHTLLNLGLLFALFGGFRIISFFLLLVRARRSKS